MQISNRRFKDKKAGDVIHLSYEDVASEKFFLDTGKEFAELSPTEQRKLIEQAMEEHSG